MILAGPGELVAACFNQLPRLEAYRLGPDRQPARHRGVHRAVVPPRSLVVWGAVVAVLTRSCSARGARCSSRRCGRHVIVVLLFECLAPGVFWSPYYKVTTKSDGDSRAWTYVNGVPHQGVMPVAQHVEMRRPVRLMPYERVGDNSLRERADHRGGHGHRRRHRADQGRAARRRRRDRSAALRDRQGEEPRPPLRRPAGRRPGQRRTGVPGAHGHARTT